MKTCNRCNQEKTLDQFPTQTKNGNVYVLPKCIICKREYDRDFWEKSKSKRNTKKSENRKVITKRNALYIREVFRQNPCKHCGETDPVVLEFDHVDPKLKTKNVSEMIYNSLANLKSEIEKCQVLCANCHRRKTAKQFNHYSYLE